MHWSTMILEFKMRYYKDYSQTIEKLERSNFVFISKHNKYVIFIQTLHISIATSDRNQADHTFSGRDRNRKLRHLWRRRRMNLSQLKSPGRRKTTSQPDEFSNSRWSQSLLFIYLLGEKKIKDWMPKWKWKFSLISPLIRKVHAISAL